MHFLNILHFIPIKAIHKENSKTPFFQAPPIPLSQSITSFFDWFSYDVDIRLILFFSFIPASYS